MVCLMGKFGIFKKVVRDSAQPWIGMIIVTTIQAQVSRFICRKTCRY